MALCERRPLLAAARGSLVGMIVAGCATGEMVMPEVGTEVAYGETVTKTFTAEFAPQTRTSISIDQAGVGSVKWQAGDAISIIQASSNKIHVIKASDISEDKRKSCEKS